MINQGALRFEPLEKEYISYFVKCANQGGLSSRKFNKKKTSIAEQLSSVSNQNVFVILRSTSPIGIFEINELDLIHRNCIINVFLEDKAESFAEYGSAIINLALSYCFCNLGLHKIRMLCPAGDPVTTEILKSLNFKPEVRWRQQFYSGGSYNTLIEWGLLSSER